MLYIYKYIAVRGFFESSMPVIKEYSELTAEKNFFVDEYSTKHHTQSRVAQNTETYTMAAVGNKNNSNNSHKEEQKF